MCPILCLDCGLRTSLLLLYLELVQSQMHRPMEYTTTTSTKLTWKRLGLMSSKPVHKRALENSFSSCQMMSLHKMTFLQVCGVKRKDGFRVSSYYNYALIWSGIQSFMYNVWLWMLNFPLATGMYNMKGLLIMNQKFHVTWTRNLNVDYTSIMDI